MTLPLPKLDARTFDQLTAEGRALIPRFAPEWTDHNYHDVGITLKEYLAWLTEMNFYRLDRVSEATERTLQRLVGVTPRPPGVAGTALEFRTVGPAAVVLPAKLPVSGGGVVFQTLDELTAIPGRLTDLLGRSADCLAANDTPGETFLPFGPDPKPGDALVLAFDLPLPATPVPVSLFAWTPTWEADADVRRRLIEEAAPPFPGPDWRNHYAVRTAWEYVGPAGWQPLPDVVDETRALSLSGFVRFRSPPDHAAGGPVPGRFAIRCRVAAGRFDRPPTLDRIAVNVAAAEHRADVTGEALGRGDGRAWQLYPVKRPPVVAGGSRLRVDGEEWQEVATWDAVGPHDRAYRLNPETGEVSCGNGRSGRVFPAGATLEIDYQTGGGPTGNLAAGRLGSTGRTDVTVFQSHLTVGGTPAETLPQAWRRARLEWERPRRAVTLADFESLALATPGVPVARVQALAEFHPDWPAVRAAGCVTVVVVPDAPGPRPVPTAELLDAVRRYLDRRRLVATEVHVIGPCYHEVAVHATLHAAPHTGGGLLDRARAVLAGFFHPLTGGPDGTGWPVGRDVYRAEVLALLAGLPGVEFVDRFGLAGAADAEPRCGNLSVCPHCLAASGSHRLRVVERSGV